MINAPAVTAWHRYERSLGRWCQVGINKPRIPKGEEDRFTVAIPVPAECMGADGQLMFGALPRAFPAPVEKVAG
jgi:hypothetical protein